MIKIIEQPMQDNIITLSDLNNGDVFMVVDNNNKINKNYLYMRIKLEKNCSYTCWNFIDNHCTSITPAQRIHKCIMVTLRYSI